MATGRPATTRVAHLTAVLGAVGVLALVFRAFPDTAVPALVSGAGAVGLAGVIRLVGRSDRTLPAVGAGLLVVPAGLGLVGGVLLVSLALVERVFPVEDAALLSVGWLLVAGNTVIVVGCSLAVLGLATSLGPALDPATLRRSMRTVLATAFVPIAAATALVVDAVTAGAVLDSTVVPSFEALFETLVGPTAAGLHLWSVLALVALGTAGVRVVVTTGPDGPVALPEGATPDGGSRPGAGLLGVVAVSGALAAVVFVVEATVGPSGVESVLGPAVYTTVRGLTTSVPLRLGLLLAAVPLLTTVIDRLHDRTAGTVLPTPSVQLWAATASGLLATLATVAVAQRLYTDAVSAAVERFPAAVRGDIRGVSDSLVESFGEPTLALAGIALCMSVTAWTLLVLYLVMDARVLSATSPGHSLCGAGLFVAVTFAGVLGGPAWLVVVGIAASLLVWDAGRFGATIAQEVGPEPTHTVELVHAGGTAVVGAVGAAVALFVASGLPPGGPGVSPTELLALCSVLVGLFSLVLALR